MASSSLSLTASILPLATQGSSTTKSSDILASTTSTFPNSVSTATVSTSSATHFSTASSSANPGSSSLVSSSSIISTSSSPLTSASTSLAPLTTTSASVLSATSPSPTTSTIVNTVHESSTSAHPVPTALSTNTQAATTRRSTIIAATAVSVGALLVVLISLFFSYKRYQRRKVFAYVDKLTQGQHTALARARLLDGEDMDMADTWSRHNRDSAVSDSWRGTPAQFHLPFNGGNMSTRSLNASIASQYSHNTQNSAPAPQLLRARGSETGSIFHEGVWPPPGEESRLVDPTRAHSSVDLSRIVDDVMGSNNEQARRRDRYTYVLPPELASKPLPQPPSDVESHPTRQDTPYTRTDSTSSYTHSRDTSATSQTGLLPSPGGSAQPKRPSPLAQTAIGRHSFGGESRTNVVFGGGPPVVHWLKRSPRSYHEDLDRLKD